VRDAAPLALIRVDANEAWTVESTRELAPELVSLGVELVEQPLPAADRDGYAELHADGLPIPIVVDESCHTLADVAPAGQLADGINIKLTKSGGIREALRMIHAARALGLKVMIGCMNESSLGIAQAAQISPPIAWTYAWQIARPSPVPTTVEATSRSSRTKRSKTSPICSGGMPSP